MVAGAAQGIDGRLHQVFIGFLCACFGLKQSIWADIEMQSGEVALVSEGIYAMLSC